VPPPQKKSFRSVSKLVASLGVGGWLCPLPRNKLVPSPVPKYTKMASPVYSLNLTIMQ